MRALARIAHTTDGWMRTRRARLRWSAVGLTLWLACCAAAFADMRGLLLAFFIATLTWMVSVFMFLFRDHWENRP